MTSPNSTSEEISSKGPLKILVAEDTWDAQILIKMFLKKTPFELDFVANGQLAIKAFKKKDYHLVLMDVTMPIMDGITAIQEIRKWENEENRPTRPIIALTARSMPDEIQDLIEKGFTAYFPKPYEKNRLLDVILKFALPYEK
jgi:CheY-like chemotaxis protein